MAYEPRTSTLKLYARNPSAKYSALTDDQLAFVDNVYELCAKNYSAGGDTVIECYEPWTVVENFRTLDEVRSFCGLRVEAEQNARWGEDTDSEVNRPAWEG